MGRPEPTSSTREACLATLRVSILESWRAGRPWFLLGGVGLLSWAILAFPPRLGQAAPVFLESLIATQVLGSLLFAGLFVAWRGAAADWPWRAGAIGALRLGPVQAVFVIAAGQGLVWLAFLGLLALLQVVGLLVEGSWAEYGSRWREFVGATLLVGIQGFWLQALARCLAAFLPQAIALIGLVGLLILGQFLGLGSVDPGALASWLRPGLEYFSQAALLDIELPVACRLALLAIAGSGALNILSGIILRRRDSGLVALDPAPNRG